MPEKVLILYGTRFGATTGTSEEIAGVLRTEGHEVKVVNTKKEKVSDISGYDLIIVGSSIMMGRWTGEPEKFLKKFQKELAAKKLALFVSSGSLPILEREGKTEELEKEKSKYLDAKVARYNLHPLATGWFGGTWNVNNKPWWSGGAMKAIKVKLNEVDFKETEPGVYDMRDWDAIRDWAKKLVEK
ncbi:flavodoxin domain-containing protein [Chloroflexota bacterium]